MKKHLFFTFVVAFCLLSVAVLVPFDQAADAQGKKSMALIPPIIF